MFLEGIFLILIQQEDDRRLIEMILLGCNRHFQYSGGGGRKGLLFTWPVIMSLYMAFQLLQNMANDHIKIDKGICHVFYMATPCNSTESVGL